MSSLYQVWRFENMLGPGEETNGHDRLYVPQQGLTTGDCDITTWPSRAMASW